MINDDILTKVIEYNHDKFLYFQNNIPYKINKEYEKILNSRYQKVGRIKRRVLYLFLRYKYIWFCTFTFSDKYINKCERTKRDLIKSSLNTHDFKYILNVDYGSKKERQHFHCILATNVDMDVNQFFQAYYIGGFSKSLLCLKGNDDIKRITKYIDKLSNHCIKASTKKQRLFYNFKGYNQFCKTSHDITIQYKLEKWLFESVSLLDKADTTGNFK